MPCPLLAALQSSFSAHRPIPQAGLLAGPTRRHLLCIKLAAGRDPGIHDCFAHKEGFVLLDRPSSHSIEHAKLVAMSYYEKDFFKKLSAQAGNGANQKKRKLDSSDFQVMAGPNLSAADQMGRLELLEVPLQPGDGELACVT